MFTKKSANPHQGRKEYENIFSSRKSLTENPFPGPFDIYLHIIYTIIWSGLA